MNNLRDLCDENDMILTVAVAGVSGAGFTSEVLDTLDFVNLMAYDGDDGAGHSPYSYAVNSFTYWKDTMGVDAKKLMIGVPFYEHPTWNAYSDIVAEDSKNAQKDTTEFNGETIYYNGIPTMKKKTEYAAKNAGGIMIWELSQDAKEEDLSLLNAIYQTAKSSLGAGKDDKKDDDDDDKKEEEDDGKKEEEDDDGKNPSGKASEWSDHKAYKVGDLVTYKGKTYKCILAHNSNEAWTPTEAITLWEETK